jgi:serine/threonine protein kinase/TolB-like protein/Flp pilus assembly protein TadD
MTRDEWRRIKAIASGALAEPESQRAAYVASHCGEDDVLRGEVESLLHSASKAANLFEGPTVVMAGAAAALEALTQFDTSRIGERVGPYRIVRSLGAGGMGSAYLAERADEAFEKRVAVKLIKRGMDTDAVLRRFRQERQILANLDHPNIARLIDGGTTADGLPYFVMEYVEGTPIDVYCDAQQLSIAERVALVRRVCDGVQYAHDRRVIHRDLKPSNVLVASDGTPKLLDFGIAKALAPETAAEQTEPTFMARAMTPPYASPEHVRGESMTRATDVYSLGVLLYELLTGHRPYRLDGRTLQEIDEIICREEPPRPSAIVDASAPGGHERRRELAGDLDNIVMMALRKEPERRYPTVSALSDDLGRHLQGLAVDARAADATYRLARYFVRHRVRLIEVGFVAAALVAIVAVTNWRRDSAPPPRSPIESVAVLPFVSASSDPAQEYLSDGLAEGVIESLSGYPRLKVSSRDASFHYKGQPLDPQRVARELNVRAVLMGSLGGGGSDVSLTLELVDGADGRRIWRETYAGQLSALVTLRQQISDAVSRQLGLPSGDRASRAAQTTDSEAYQLYLRGRYLWNKRTEEGFTRGLEYFQQALARDPNYALAYTGLADCYNLLGIWGALPPHEAMPKVKDAALKAIAIDDSLAEAHTSLAFVHWVYDWDLRGAEAEFIRALELDPTYATAHDWYAYYLASLDRFDEAIQHITRAQQLEPVSLSINTDVGEIYYWAGQHDRAIAALQNVLQVEPEFAMARNILGLTYLKVGRLEDAIAELERANQLATGPRMLSTLAYGYGVAGSRAKARSTIETLRRLSSQRYTSAFALGIAYAGVGDRDRAIAQLEQAFAERSDSMVILRVYPVLDGLHADARFQDLVRRIGFPRSP